MTISERVFDLARQQKRTQGDIAAAVGVRQATVSAWKYKNTIPSSEFIAPLASLFGVSCDFLCTGVEATQAASVLFLSALHKELLARIKKAVAYNIVDAVDLIGKVGMYDYSDNPIIKYLQNECRLIEHIPDVDAPKASGESVFFSLSQKGVAYTENNNISGDGNVVNKQGIFGDRNQNNTVTIHGNGTLEISEFDGELIKVCGRLDMRRKNALLTYAYDLEKQMTDNN